MKLSFHENHRLLFGTIFLGFVFLTVIIAVGPAIWVQQNNRPLPGSRPLTQEESEGRDIYIEEGCLYCHTQQVRPLDVDTPFGRPSAPGDYARLRPQDIWRMTPEMTQTERTGPDLSNVGNREPSDIWQYIHLYNPRAVSKGSVMQAYPWFFEVKDTPDSRDVVVPVPEEYTPASGKVVATRKALRLVSYVLSLRQVPILEATGTSGQQTPPSTPRPESGSSKEGQKIYDNYCASCHQSNGEGVPGAFPPLKSDPVVTDKDPNRHIRIVLFGLQSKEIEGVHYSAAMPSHENALSDAQIAAVINHERTSWGNNAPTVAEQAVKKIRHEKGPGREE